LFSYSLLAGPAAVSARVGEPKVIDGDRRSVEKSTENAAHLSEFTTTTTGAKNKENLLLPIQDEMWTFPVGPSASSRLQQPPRNSNSNYNTVAANFHQETSFFPSPEEINAQAAAAGFGNSKMTLVLDQRVRRLKYAKGALDFLWNKEKAEESTSRFQLKSSSSSSSSNNNIIGMPSCANIDTAEMAFAKKEAEKNPKKPLKEASKFCSADFANLFTTNGTSHSRLEKGFVPFVGSGPADKKVF